MTQPPFSLQQVDKTKWRVFVSMGDKLPSGSYRQKTKVFTARTKREAKERAADWAAMVRSDENGGTFRALAEAWYTAKLATNKPSTMRGYRTKLDRHILPVLGPVQLIDLDRQTMASWYDGLTVEGRTRNQLVAIVRSLVRWGVQRGRLSSDSFLAPLVTTTSGLARTHAPASDDLAVLLRHLAGRNGDPLVFTVVYLAAATGARRGELLGLTVADVNLEVGSMRVLRSIDRTGPVEPKTESSRRVVALPAQAVTVLAAYVEGLRRFFAVVAGDPSFVLDGRQWLFPSPQRVERHWYPEAISKAVARHVVAAGLPPGAVVLHRLRNRSITELGNAGLPSKAIAERHGHSHVSVTEGVYMGRLPAQDVLAAEIIGRSMDELMGGG